MKRKIAQKPSSMLPVAVLLGSVVIAVAIIFSGILWFINAQEASKLTPKEVYENIGFVKIDKSPTLGDKNAPVTVIEYTDFDCAICKVASDEVLPQLKQDYIATGKVKFIFKSLPIEYLHKNAFRKTEGAFCAKELGGDNAFFAYYDSLFENFGFSLNLDNELASIAKKHGLNEAEFRTCLMSRRYREVINEEVLEGNLIGSLGTPTWLIGKSDGDGLKDTVKINGLIEYKAFSTVLDRQFEEIK